jgi:(p)ppGpp synthase/HD superfamily hydrolase
MIQELAKTFAQKKHEGQLRKFSKEQYIEHPIKVSEIIKENKNSHKINELLAAAFLHDPLENTNTNEKELEKNFGELITSLVKELTSEKEMQNQLGKKEYLAKKMETISSWALVIKLADRLDNVSDLNQCSEEFRKKYAKETNFILTQLKKKRKLSQTHKKLIKKIEEKIND